MYVPNAHTDFIFSILGEETGLVGEIIVIGLFAVLVYAGVRVAVRAPDLFGRLVAEAGFAFRGVPVQPFVRRVSPSALRGPLAALRAVRRCRPVVRDAVAV